jgi:hypothetical protein
VNAGRQIRCGDVGTGNLEFRAIGPRGSMATSLAEILAPLELANRDRLSFSIPAQGLRGHAQGR